MPKSFEFSVELPDGSVATRRTSTRLYQYAVGVRGTHSWGAPTWSGTKVAADKAAQELRRRHPAADVKVLPVGRAQVEAALAACPHLSVESLQSKSRRGARW